MLSRRGQRSNFGVVKGLAVDFALPKGRQRTFADCVHSAKSWWKAITRSTIALRYTVVKSRGSKHSLRYARAFVVGQGGLNLLPLEQSMVANVSLQDYSSLVNRAATTFSLKKRIKAAVQDTEGLAIT
jgi:hypothetical protein